MKYTRKELEKIYYESKFEELNRPELMNIKSQLNTVCSNTFFNADDFSYLIELLNYIKIEQLNMIDEEFIKFANKIANNKELKWMQSVNTIITVLFNDYKNNTADYIINLIPWLYDLDESDRETLKKYNICIASILNASQKFLKNRPLIPDYNLLYIETIHDIFNRSSILFLSDIERYDYDYSLPNTVINYIINNYDRLEKLIGIFYLNEYTRGKDYGILLKNNIFIKLLLNHFSKKSKLVTIEELELKKELKSKSYDIDRMLR